MRRWRSARTEIHSSDQPVPSGVVFVVGYSTYFFELAGFATDNAFNLGVGVTACGVSVAILSK